MKFHGIEIPNNQYFSLDVERIFPSESLSRDFFFPLHTLLKSKLVANASTPCHIDFDRVKNKIENLLASLNSNQVLELKQMQTASKVISPRKAASLTVREGLMIFLLLYPYFSDRLQNIHLSAEISVRASEHFMGQPVTTKNFVRAKAYIDEISRSRWTREQDKGERQSGVSNLGRVSELLLERALNALIDHDNFFKTNDPKVKTYGDFVLMCLPNNLWISVKSNYARERLLASGYTTDIIGVGFFTDMKEFISPSKIRNFQRVGFLCMYLPDVPITTEQVSESTSTYEQVVTHFQGKQNLPRNINGTFFIRSLSELYDDLLRLLSIKELANRTTTNY